MLEKRLLSDNARNIAINRRQTRKGLVCTKFIKESDTHKTEPDTNRETQYLLAMANLNFSN